MVKRQYQIGHVQLEIALPRDMQVPGNMQKFAHEAQAIQKYYKIVWESDLASVLQQIRAKYDIKREMRRETIQVLDFDGGECRLLFFHGMQEPYAIYLDITDKEVMVWVWRGIYTMTQYDTVFVSLLALEKLMLKYDALILHSAYMERNGEAILFSAPSGTGKSTQADLWERYRGTRTINGDRSLLVREEDGWHAYGWPVCGSSGICSNEELPIRTIVMLHQAKENSIERLRGAALFQKLVSQVTINMWNTESQIKTFDLIEQLVKDVVVYELGCDISLGAVECLERELIS